MANAVPGRKDANYVVNMLDLVLSIKGKSVKNTQKLIGYLSKKLHSIHQIYASFENNHQNKISSLANSGLLKQDIGYRAYRRLEYIEGNLFRQAMLIMVCSYLEEAMDLIGEAVISEYPDKISKKKGNWFERRKKLFEEVGVSFKEIEEECERINDLRLVRNCIVHSGGRIEKYRYSAKVKESVKRLKERDKNRNVNLVEITADKFLYLGDNVIPIAIIASEEIISKCSKATSGKK